MVQSSFFSDTPNYATSYPTQNDSNTNPVQGNKPAPSSFYPNGTQYTALANSDTLQAEIDADLAAAQAAQVAAALSETNAAASATAASGSATAAAGSASAASTSATNAAASATSASGSATTATTQAGIATTQAGNASTSATAAAGSATTASTQAGNASTSATNAAASATAASGSATTASTQAGNAATSATNAANSASAAATSATNAASAVQAVAGTVTPVVDGTAAVGTSTKWAHEDHIHPTDTTRAPLASPALTGTPTAPTATALDNSTKLATTAYADAAVAVEKSRAQTAEGLLAPLASPALTGTPTAPTATAGTNTTQLATTAFVLANGGALPAAATPLVDGTAAVGTATKYAREDHVHPTDTSRAPFEAMALRNLVYNGCMELDYINYGAATAGTGLAVNEWQVSKNGTCVVSAIQNTDAPPGFINSLQVTVSTAEASMAAGDYVFIHSAIEATRVAFMQWGTANAQTVTLAFWIKMKRTGTYSGSIRNAAFSRSYAFSFTVNAADTWEFKTVTIAGDTSGTWAGMDLSITMAAGSTYLGTASTWGATNLLGATGSTNGVAATTDYVRITGISLLPGSVTVSSASSAQLRRPYDVEALLCKLDSQWQTYSGATAVFSSGSGTVSFRYKQIGKVIFVNFRLACTSTGTLSYVSVPVLPPNAGMNYTLIGREIARTGIIWFLQVNQVGQYSGGTYSNGLPSMNTGDTIDFSGVYEAA